MVHYEILGIVIISIYTVHYSNASVKPVMRSARLCFSVLFTSDLSSIVYCVCIVLLYVFRLVLCFYCVCIYV